MKADYSSYMDLSALPYGNSLQAETSLSNDAWLRFCCALPYGCGYPRVFITPAAAKPTGVGYKPKYTKAAEPIVLIYPEVISGFAWREEDHLQAANLRKVIGAWCAATAETGGFGKTCQVELVNAPFSVIQFNPKLYSGYANLTLVARLCHVSHQLQITETVSCVKSNFTIETETYKHTSQRASFALDGATYSYVDNPRCDGVRFPVTHTKPLVFEEVYPTHFKGTARWRRTNQSPSSEYVRDDEGRNGHQARYSGFVAANWRFTFELGYDTPSGVSWHKAEFEPTIYNLTVLSQQTCKQVELQVREMLPFLIKSLPSFFVGRGFENTEEGVVIEFDFSL